MGALHRGHEALLERARRENGSVAASIFVNPLQFGPGEDYERYPRAFEADCALLEAAGVDLLYAPPADRMYPPGFASEVRTGSIADRYEGSARPGHFTGVATVVAKLLHAIEPTSLYLGQKDVQQTAVLRRMVHDLDMAQSVIVVPTVREADGLALSSRNVYLSAAQRAAAPSIYRALTAVAETMRGGERDRERALEAGRRAIEVPLELEYLDIVEPSTFEPRSEAVGPAVILAVARAGATRLLDNLPVAGPDGIDPVLSPGREHVSNQR
jgi:pantoate--beta-alanine ligase